MRSDRRATRTAEAPWQDADAPDPRSVAPPVAPPPWRTAGVIVAVTAGALLAASIDFWPWEGDDMRRQPQFQLWLMLVGVQAAVWAVGGVLAWASLHELRSFARGYRLRLAVILGAVTVLALAFRLGTIIFGPDSDIPDDALRFSALWIPAIAVGGVAVLAMLLVDATLRRLDAQVAVPNVADVRAFLALRGHLDRLLVIVAAIVAGAILGATVLRNAVLKEGDLKATDYPAEYVLVYGVFYSALIAVAYVPVQRRLREVGRRFRDATLGLESPTEWSAWLERRNALDRALALDVATPSALRSGLAILSPLISTGVGLLIGKT
jgi:hypothetical protein